MCGRHKTAGDNKNGDSASPIVAKESVFTTAAVDAHEGRCVAIFDIIGGSIITQKQKRM